MSLISRVTSMFRRDEPRNAVEFSPELWAAIQDYGLNQVSWRKAIEVSAVLACARIYANDLAGVPWKIMRDMPNGDKVEAKDHRYYEMITYEPNPWQTSFEFRQTLGFHLALEGNAFVWLDRVGPRSEKITGLLPLEPSWVTVCRDKNDWTKIVYQVRFPDGKSYEYDNRQVWHLRNLAWNGYSGISALSYARDAVKLAQDIAGSQSDTHKNSAKPSGILNVKQTMTPPQFKAVRELLDFQVQTRLSRGLPMVTDETMEWISLAAKATDMQSVEARKQIVEEIAVHMGILPAMAGFNSDGSQSYASVEQLLIRHNVHFKMPLMNNFMQSSDRWILSREERRGGFYNYMVDQAILRGDIKTRGEFYRLMWMIGAITGNEIRRFEDMNPIEGLDRPWAPLANAPIGEDGMPMITDNENLDNNFKSEEDIAAKINALNPQMRQRAISVLKMLTKPEEGENL